MSRSTLITTIYESYQKEIRNIRRSGNILLQKIKQHETMMNIKKQMDLPTTLEDCYKLSEMATRLSQMLSLIQTYEFYQNQNMPLIDEYMPFFYQMYGDKYRTYLNNFRLRLMQLQNVDFINDFNVDFNVERNI